jgi:hypothetical protein
LAVEGEHGAAAVSVATDGGAVGSANLDDMAGQRVVVLEPDAVRAVALGHEMPRGLAGERAVEIDLTTAARVAGGAYLS